MTRLDIQLRVKALREELETRHKQGTVKTAANFDGESASTKELQNELFSLLYRLSKME
jgi:hypothetical protein